MGGGGDRQLPVVFWLPRCTLLLPAMASIVCDEEVFAQFKAESRNQYKRMWTMFRDFSIFDFESGPPGEEYFTKFFQYLRLEKHYASSSMWTFYSCLNSIMKRKYNVKLQELPRLTMLIKGFDTDIKDKATIFDEMQMKSFMLGNMESTYWLVRQAISILAFFGGLRLQECMDLCLEKIVRNNDGYKVTHSRCKQRSDQRETAFLVPAHGGFAERLADYLEKVYTNLNKFTGRVFWTGTKGNILKNQPMGKNMVGKVPHDVATRLRLAKPEDYTFHSYRRTSATSAANGGMTSEQMQGFFGWKNASMCQEYISTSRPAIMQMAQTLCSFDMPDPEVEVEFVLPDKVVSVKEDVREETDLSNFVMEEDPEMYEAAGIPSQVVLQTTDNSVLIQQSIESAISSVPSLQGANVVVKVCVIGSNHGTVNMNM